MSGGNGTHVDTAVLAAAATKAAGTQAASVISAVVAPPETVSSELDGALVLLSTTTEVRRSAEDLNDGGRAEKQTAALTESPPQIAAQDAQNATEYQVWTI